ncbi:MAG: hypothetical protein IPM54_31450 [Polyangiaceae bacterium]|nr:hypothetical protein [Polyangiaceae bacterium]
MLTTRSSIALLALALAAFGCESKKTEGAASSPAAPSATTTPAPGTKSADGAAKKSFPSPDKFDIVPLAVGQAVRMLVTTPGQPPSQTFVRVVGKEGDAFWYEIESNTPTGTTIVQFLMEDAMRTNFSKTSIKKLRMKMGLGPVQEFSGATLAAVGNIADSYVALLGKPNLDKAERADATVKAGEFKGCYVHEIDQSLMGMSMKIKSWNHPAVPINGFVRSEGTVNGNATTTELVDMQMEGAKSALQ